MRTTPSTHRKLGFRNLCAAALLLGVAFGAGAADDTALFSTSFPPNVLLMVDNSNSMNEIMRHPASVSQPPPGWPYAGCTILPTSGGGTINDQNGTPTSYSCYPGFPCWFTINPSSSGFTAADTTSSSTHQGDPDNGYITRKFCGQTRKLWHDGQLTHINGSSTNSNPTWIDNDYLEWLFHLDPASSTTYGPANQTAAQILAELDDTANGRHYIGGATFGLYHRSRITALREVARDVIYKTNTNGTQYDPDCRPGCSQDVVRFGLGQFTSAMNGGFVSVPVAAYSSNAAALENGINLLDPSTGTPLSETLFKLWTYFMPRGTSTTARPLGLRPGATQRFPEYVYNMTDGAYTTTTSLRAPDPAPASCQKNFIIMITDGQPSGDDFGVSGNETQGFSIFRTQLVGDYAPDTVGALDIGTDSTPEEGNPPFQASDGNGYLDDIAKAMQDADTRPDLAGTQKVDVYTIGLATDPVANALLAHTAANGNGIFRASWQAQELSDALVEAINDIIVKAQAFTAATVPASRATDGNNFFASYFRPDNTVAYWEGHLKLFEYNAKGEVLDKPVPPATTGLCALEDPLAPAQCKVGRLKVELNGYWDAANVIPPADEAVTNARKLYVSAYTTAPPSTTPATPASFTVAAMTAAHLGITVSGSALTTLISTYANSTGITTAEGLADAIVRYVRGCLFSSSTTCTDRGAGLKLWDIFHSNPIVVGPPNSGSHDLSYKEFVNRYAHRKRVIFAGSNGGFVHGFNTGEWDTTLTPANYNRGTGREEFGFMAWPARQQIKSLPTSTTSKLYLMDGSPQAADVWLYPTATSTTGTATNWNEWRTVLIGGMRQGGRSLYALDVTNPPDTANPSGVSGGPSYPGYLWEFPCESTNTLCTGSGLPSGRSYANYMGQSWSEPVVTKVKVRIDCTDTTTTTCPRYDRWVAIFGAGYDENADPNKPWSATPSATQYDSSNSSSTIREGRALFMVDIKSGNVLAMQRYDNSTSNGNPEMKYAFTATPSVFDLDFDGYADVVYAADLGGNVWKWLIHDAVLDQINGSTGTILHNATGDNWPFFKIFTAGSCGTAEGCTVPHYRSFFYPPTGAMVDGTVWLALGSGERNNLPYIGTHAAEKNRYYVFEDKDPFEHELAAVTTGSRFTDVSPATDFVNASSLTGSCNPPPSPAIGFYLEGEQGEKFVTDSTIFFGVVLTSSYKPTTSTDPCTVGGESFLYGFKLFCGQGIFQPVTTGDPMRTNISIGGGLPNRPRVSVGPVSGGGGGGGCSDMVVVITSEGGAYTNCPGGRPDSGIHTKAWRDN